MKYKFLLVISILFLFLITGRSFGKGNKPIKLQLKWRHQFQFAGYYAAQIKGFYKDEGLDIQINEGGPGILPVKEVLSGRSDIGIFDPGVLFNNKNGNQLVVLSTIMQSSPYVIISLKEKKILKPVDLIGKKVLAEQDQGWSIFKAVLLKEGIKPELIEVLRRDKDSEEIGDNKADAVVTYLTTQPQRLKALGYDINIIRPVEYGIDFYGDVIFSKRSFAYSDTEVTDAFLRATIKGWEYAFAHEDEMIAYILTLQGVKEYGNNKNFLKYEAAEVRKLMMPDLVQIGHMNVGRWQYMLALYQQLNLADKSISLKDFLYTPDTENNKWIRPVIYTLILAGVIFFFILFINWQLRKSVRQKTSELLIEIESRKRAELQANQNQQKLELAISSANIGLWDWDVKSNELTFNRQSYEILELNPNQVKRGFDPFALLHPKDINTARREFKRCIVGSNKSEYLQLRIRKANGDYIYLLTSFFVCRNEVQQAVKVSGVVINIDDIKKKEFELMTISDELLKSNNELKKFAYIISHNLRGPVVNISTLISMIDQSSINEENDMILDKVGFSVRKLENTLNDLIEVVSHQKPETRALTLLNLDEELHDTMQSIESQIKESGVSITTNFGVRSIIYSKSYLNSIFLNLLTNAIKYRSEDRPLNIHIATKDENGTTILVFEDNGKGINMEKNGTKIFGLYQRFHTHVEGKGIGLFMIKSHIESLGGTINVKSILDKGTIFEVRFAKI